jgi:hypothetical protein
LGWSKTIKLARDFEETYEKISRRVETAKTWKQELSWKSYREGYVKLIRKNRSAFKALKKSVAANATLASILQQLQTSLATLFKLKKSTETKWQALQTSKQIWAQFKAELDKQVKSEYDMFRKREFEPDPKLCFVLMPFDEQDARRKPFKQIYRTIRSTVRRAKLKCKRADEIFGVKPIVQDIWESINRAELVIADLTGRNPNVFYEAGLSHALPKKLIQISQTMDDVPFDVRPIRTIVYQNTGSGRKKLSKDLYRTIRSALQ